MVEAKWGNHEAKIHIPLIVAFLFRLFGICGGKALHDIVHKIGLYGGKFMDNSSSGTIRIVA